MAVRAHEFHGEAIEARGLGCSCNGRDLFSSRPHSGGDVSRIEIDADGTAAIHEFLHRKAALSMTIGQGLGDITMISIPGVG